MEPIALGKDGMHARESVRPMEPGCSLRSRRLSCLVQIQHHRRKESSGQELFAWLLLSALFFCRAQLCRSDLRVYPGSSFSSNNPEHPATNTQQDYHSQQDLGSAQR